MKRLDITGERYGKLVAISRQNKPGQSRWIFQCDCGKTTSVLLGNVRTGQVASCGCAGSRTTIGIRSLKHGHVVGFKKSRTSMAWRNAKTRCFNKNHEKYSLYGGRGITMCKEWSDDFSAFLRDMGECPPGLTLDRIDVNGNYEPGNCRWETPAVQALNKQNTIRIGGVSLREFVESKGLNYQYVHRRMRLHGENAEQAVNWFILKLPRSSRNTKRNH